MFGAVVEGISKASGTQKSGVLLYHPCPFPYRSWEERLGEEREEKWPVPTALGAEEERDK